MDDAAEIGAADENRWADLTLSMPQLMRRVGRWVVPITVCCFLPYLLVWGWPDLPEWRGLGPTVLDILIGTLVALLLYAVSAFVHEALHIAAMVMPVSRLEVGMRLSEGVVYVHAKEPMSARAYRIVLLVPAVILGVVPVVVGVLEGQGWVVVYGYVMLLSAIGDLVVLRLMKRVDARTLVRDHPEQLGCQVRVTPPSP